MKKNITAEQVQEYTVLDYLYYYTDGPSKPRDYWTKTAQAWIREHTHKHITLAETARLLNQIWEAKNI